jgi:two-component system, cell cycle sensor histidine kinase and response regulator CckA
VKSETLEEIHAPLGTRPLRALLLEDSPDDVDLLLLQLSEAGFCVDPTLVETQAQFRSALAEKDYDVVLSDYRLPSWNGIDAFHELRSAGKDIPFLLVTGTLGEEAAVDCIKQGVNDYILKDHLSRLPAALTRALTDKALRDENARAHEALRISEIRNRDLVENAVYGIFRVSADGDFLYANLALLRIVGCPDAAGLKTLNLASDVFRFPEQYAQLMTASRDQGQLNGAEAEWRRSDGGIVVVRLHLRWLSCTGHPDTLEVIAEDVTEMRAMERQLRHSQKFEAIGQLAGGIAHDFNNAIGAILGWAELGFDQNRGAPQVAERFSRIREQAERAAALTRELLAFSRRQVLQPRAVDLNNVTSGLVSFLDKIIGKQIELKLQQAPLDSVKADPAQIEQVLMNLCLNARDAMPEGGRLVIETEMVELDESYCRFYPQVAPGRYAVISVSDTGTGMDVETRERIFEPFFTTKERGKATGMGLATAYGIVKQHGGFIHVYSEPSHGSLFRVYLRATDKAATEGAAKTLAPCLAEMHGTETILLADDHESIREMSRQTLVSLGYRVLSARDGEEALRLCEHEKPALAILDVIMPKLGGAATAARLASRFAALPVLYTSGYSASSDNMPACDAKTRYLQKPYSPTTLGRLVRQILDEPQAEATPADEK